MFNCNLYCYQINTVQRNRGEEENTEKLFHVKCPVQWYCAIKALLILLFYFVLWRGVCVFHCLPRGRSMFGGPHGIQNRNRCAWITRSHARFSKCLSHHFEFIQNIKKQQTREMAYIRFLHVCKNVNKFNSFWRLFVHMNHGKMKEVAPAKTMTVSLAQTDAFNVERRSRGSKSIRFQNTEYDRIYRIIISCAIVLPPPRSPCIPGEPSAQLYRKMISAFSY